MRNSLARWNPSWRNSPARSTQPGQFAGSLESKLAQFAGAQEAKLAQFAGAQESKLAQFAGSLESKQVQFAGDFNAKLERLTGRVESLPTTWQMITAIIAGQITFAGVLCAAVFGAARLYGTPVAYGHQTQMAVTSVATLTAKVAAMPGARISGPSR